MTSSSAIYNGVVNHRRLRPKAHVLSYRVFWLLLDLAELERLNSRLKSFSHNRFNLLAFHDRDHGDGSTIPLREQITALLDKAGVDLEGGAVRLLTMPRVLGYVFNPISVYYCHHIDGRLVALVYEVTSTFGIRHAYVIPVAEKDISKARFIQSTGKALYVSPFMGMEMDYHFRGNTPAEHLGLIIDGHDRQGLLINASIAAERRELTDKNILAVAASMPLLTIKVIVAIHWEALKLWIKGIKPTRQPAPAEVPVSVQSGPNASRLG